jgi:hypothetical protein
LNTRLPPLDPSSEKEYCKPYRVQRLLALSRAFEPLNSSQS